MRAFGRVAAAAVLVASAALLGVVPAAEGGCVGPVIGIGAPPDQPVASPTPARVDRSAEVAVAGKWFFDGCADTFAETGCAAGDRSPQPLETQTPRTDVDLVLTQGSRTWTLATADAGPEPDYAITWRFAIPADAADGPATLSAQQVELPIMITD